MAITNVVNANGTTPLPVGQGGTSATTLTIHGLLKGDAAGAVSALPAATDGQLPIGSTGADPVMATLTQGSGITITNAAGSITIAASGGGSGVSQIDGNTGSAVGATILFDGTTDAGSSVSFDASGTTVSLRIGDIDNCFVGLGSGNNTLSGDSNTCLGKSIMPSITSGLYNTGVGLQPLQSLDAGSDNAAFGRNSLGSLTSGSSNIAVGSAALGGVVDGGYNIGLGYFAGQSYTGTESSNIVISNSGVVGESNTIRIGTQGSSLGEQNAAYMAGVYGVTPGGMGIQNVVIDSNGQLGSSSGGGGGGITELEADDTNTASGSTVTIAGDTSNIFTTADNASTVTISQGPALILPSTNTTLLEGVINIGGQVVLSTPGSNVFVGNSNGNGTLTGSVNVALGAGIMPAIDAGNYNIGIGLSALAAMDFGEENIAIGHNALTTANSNTALYNVGIGFSSLSSLATGAANLALGLNAGGALTGTESSNILLMNNGVAGDNNTIRIGTEGNTQGLQNTCFIAGIANATVTGSPVLIDITTGQLGLAVSSERFKDRITDMAERSDRVMQLRPVNFAYKQDATHGMQWGLIAEEVADIMPELVTYDMLGAPYTVRYNDLPAILLNELQKLSKRVAELESKCKE